jgi:ubiquinone/menaquinone biosynthesis C-methylase UbiE
MDRTEFDKFAAEYEQNLKLSIGASGEGPEYFTEYKVRDVFRTARDSGVAVHRLLDFGCGIGPATPYFHAQSPITELVGVDVSQKSLEIARERCGSLSTYHAFDGDVLPFADNQFDVVFAACVFHHIPEAAHVSLLAEIRRVLSPQGLFFVFEHNPLNPLTVRVVNQCIFDENAVLIRAGQLSERLRAAGMRSIENDYRISFPDSCAPSGAWRGL